MGQRVKVSHEDDWMEDELKVIEEEKKTSYDFQFAKKGGTPTPIRNNNVVVNVRNQFDETMPFYTSPIGGVPKYKYSVIAEPID